MNFILPSLLLLACTKGGFPLKCYSCHTDVSRDGRRGSCENPKELVCDPEVFLNGSSCINMQYRHAGYDVTIRDCHGKVEELAGNMKLAGFNQVAKYAACHENLCNGSVGGNKRIFYVFVSIFVTFLALHALNC